MGKWSIHGRIKVTGSFVAMVCVPIKLGYVFTVGSFSALKSLLEKWLNFHLGPEQSHTNKFCKKWQLRFIMQHTVKQLGEIWVKISGSIYKNVKLDTNVYTVSPPFPLRNLILNCCKDMFPIPWHKYKLFQMFHNIFKAQRKQW